MSPKSPYNVRVSTQPLKENHQPMEKPRCPKCQSRQIYFLADGTIVCRGCGTRTKPK